MTSAVDERRPSVIRFTIMQLRLQRVYFREERRDVIAGEIRTLMRSCLCDGDSVSIR